MLPFNDPKMIKYYSYLFFVIIIKDNNNKY